MRKLHVGVVGSLLLLSGCVTDQKGEPAKAATTVDTSKSASFVRLARSASAGGDVDSAIDLLKQGIVGNPKAADFYVELSEIYMRQGKVQDAINVLENGSKNNQDSVQISRKLGNAYLMIEEPEKALVIFDTALETNKDDALIYSSKGIALDMLGRTDEARQAYDTSLKIDQESVSSLNNLAMSHILSSDLKQAKDILEKIAFKKSAPSQVRQNLAFVYALLGENEKSKKIGLRDLSEHEVKENIDFYKKVSGFMISENSDAAITPVVAKEESIKPQAAKLENVAKQLPEVAKAAAVPAPLVAAKEELKAPVEDDKNTKLVAAKVEEPAKVIADPAPLVVAKEELKAPVEDDKNSKLVAVLPEASKVASPPEYKNAAEAAAAIAKQENNKKTNLAAATPVPASAAEVEFVEVPQKQELASLPEAPKPTQENPANQKNSLFGWLSENVKPEEAAKPEEDGTKLQTSAEVPASDLGSLKPAAGFPWIGKPEDKPQDIKLADATPSAEVKTANDRENVFSPKNSKKYFVQLGQYKNSKEAEKAWNEAASKVSALKNYKFMFWDAKDGDKKLVFGPFSYAEQYSSITKDLEAKKLSYNVVDEGAKK